MLDDLLKGAGYHFTVHNGGIWGDTTGKLLERLQRVLSEACSKGRLAYVLVLGGTNDILRKTGSAPQIVNQLRQLHDMAGKAPYMPRVGVLTLPPIKKGIPAWEHARLGVNDSLRRAAAGPAASSGAGAGALGGRRQFLVDLESVDVALSSDGVHFTAEGYAEFARRAFEAMLATLPKPKSAAAAPAAKAA